MPMPSARRDRWLALALLLAVLGLAYLLLVHPWFTQPLREIDADVAALREALDDEVAGIMLTNPNTLGLFEEDIAEIVAKWATKTDAAAVSS